MSTYPPPTKFCRNPSSSFCVNLVSSQQPIRQTSKFGKKKKKKSTLCSACILQISRPDHLHRNTTTLRELIMFHMCFFVDISLPDLTMLWASQDITRSEAQAGHFQVGAALPQGAEEAYTSKILSSSTGSQCWVTQRRLSDVCKQRCWHYHQRPPCRFPFPLAKSHIQEESVAGAAANSGRFLFETVPCTIVTETRLCLFVGTETVAGLATTVDEVLILSSWTRVGRGCGGVEGLVGSGRQFYQIKEKKTVLWNYMSFGTCGWGIFEMKLPK